MNILHTESSTGWGGQEMRILREALAMRELGFTVVMAIGKGGILSQKAAEEGLEVIEFPFETKNAFSAIPKLISIIRKYDIQIIQTHSSADAWLAGIAARLTRRKLIRTRHISAPIKPGLNSYLLYNVLADRVITTCESVAEIIRKQAGLTVKRCLSIPTGIEPIQVDEKEVVHFKEKYGIQPHHFVVGTVCILRSWKGIGDLLEAAYSLKQYPHFRWLIVGDGPCRKRYEEQMQMMGLEKTVIFTGFVQNPFPAMQTLDVFALLSSANEGVSQASLQAAYLKRPLITTRVGGLGEVCLDGMTGYTVPISSPSAVQRAVLSLYENPHRRQCFGQNAHQLVMERFTFDKTIENVIKFLFSLK